MAADRRKFLKQVALGSGAIISGGTIYALSENKTVMDKKNVLQIRPLGFQWETKDPFLFCVHHEDDFPAGNEHMGPIDSLEGRHIGQDFVIKDGWRMYHGQKVPGFPGHPHRGFETITVVRKGLVDHSDSLGAAGRYGNGDVQWMTAGKGLQHAEMFPLLKKDERNPLELFQIWLNLPAKSKMVEPHFKMLWHETLPVVNLEDDNKRKTQIEVIAGKLFDNTPPSPPPNSWAADQDNHVAVWNITMEANAELDLPATAEGVNRSLYFYEGASLKIEDKDIPEYHAADVNPTENLHIKAGNSQTKVLVLQGKPLNEPVVQHGPFVMNSRKEIQEAFAEFQQTRFGGWPWDTYENVHDRAKGRFAKHADGREEIKDA